MKNITWGDVALGAWLLVSPWALSYAWWRPVVLAEDVLPAVFLIASSLLILGVRIAPLRANWLQGISGLWLIIGSFVLLFNHLSKASLNSLIVGALVLTVSVAAMWSLTRQSA